MPKWKVFVSTPIYETIDFVGENPPTIEDLDGQRPGSICYWDEAYNKEYGDPEIIDYMKVTNA